MKKIIVVLLALSVAGCTQSGDGASKIKNIGCEIGKTVGMGLSFQIADSLACTNVDAINNDIYDVLVKVKLCELPTLEEGASLMSVGSIAAQACKSVGSMLFMSLTAEKFAAWGCTGGVAQEKLLEKLDELCAKLEPTEQ